MIIAGAILISAAAIVYTLNRGFHRMSDALDRLTASVGAIADSIDANDLETSQVVAELRKLAHAGGATDDSQQLFALADRLDASRQKLANDSASLTSTVSEVDPPPPPPPADTPPSGSGDDTIAAPVGDDTVSG